MAQQAFGIFYFFCVITAPAVIRWVDAWSAQKHNKLILKWIQKVWPNLWQDYWDEYNFKPVKLHYLINLLRQINLYGRLQV